MPSRALHYSQYQALALMYFTQGLPAGLAFYAMAALIRQAAYPLAWVGLSGLAVLPWAFKFLWASAMDNACARHGHALPIGITQWLAVLLCLVLARFAPATSLAACMAGVVALNLVCATQDIVSNAYAVSLMQGRRAGAANAIQVAAFIGGMLSGGGGFLWLHDAFGWALSMQCMAALLALLWLPLFLGRSWRAGAAAGVGLQPVRLRDLRQHADLGWAIAIALLFKCAGSAVSTLMQPWLVDGGWSLARVGQLQMTILLAHAAGGVLIGVPLLRRLGERRAVLLGCAGSAALLGTAWGLHTAGIQDARLLHAAFGAQALVDGAMYVAIWALFMNWTCPQRPGTDFTAMQCSESLANGLAAGAIGALGQAVGYGLAFLLAWLAGGVVALGIARCLPRIRLHRELRAENVQA